MTTLTFAWQTDRPFWSQQRRPRHDRNVAGYRVIIPDKDHERSTCPCDVAWLRDTFSRTTTMSRQQMAAWLRQNRHR